MPKKAGWAATSSVAMGWLLRRGEETEASSLVDLDPNVHARQFRLSAGHASASLREKGQRHGAGRDIPGGGQGLPAHGKKNRFAARLGRGRSTGPAVTRRRCRALATMPTPEKGGSHYLTAGPLHFVRAPWTCGSRSSGMIRTASAGQWLRCGQPDADRSCHRSAGVGTWKHTL